MKLSDEKGNEYEFEIAEETAWGSGVTYGKLKPIKPKPKKIDMSVCIESGIDCEFSEYHDFRRDTNSSVGKLSLIDMDSKYPFEFDNGDNCKEHCRPRFNHIHASPTGFVEMPLPEGFEIKAWYRDDEIDVLTTTMYNDMSWGTVIMFQVTGIQENYTL